MITQNNLQYTVKAVLRGNFITFRTKMNNQIKHLKALEKQEQTKPIIKRRSNNDKSRNKRQN